MGFFAPFTARHRYKLFDGLEQTSLLEIPLIYARLGISVESIIIAHNAPHKAPIMSEINKYFGLEHLFDVLQKISAKIITGNTINVATFWVIRLFTLMKYVR